MSIYFTGKYYSEKFIRDYVRKNKISRLIWKNISNHQELSEKFIEDFKDKVCFYRISAFQKLSEPFIRKFKSKVDWINICLEQELSISFIDEMVMEGFIKPEYFKYLLKNGNVNQEELLVYLSM